MGGGENEYNIDMCVELFSEAEWEGGHITYKGMHVHIVRAVNMRINGKHAKLLVDCLPESLVSLWCNPPRYRLLGPASYGRAAPVLQFLTCLGNPPEVLSFWGGYLIDPSHQGSSRGVA